MYRQMVLSEITPVDNFTVRIIIIDIHWVYFCVVFIIAALIVMKQYDLQKHLVYHCFCFDIKVVNYSPQLIAHFKYVCYLINIWEICLFFCGFIWLFVNGTIEIGSLARLTCLCRVKISSIFWSIFKTLLPELCVFFLRRVTSINCQVAQLSKRVKHQQSLFWHTFLVFMCFFRWIGMLQFKFFHGL